MTSYQVAGVILQPAARVNEPVWEVEWREARPSRSRHGEPMLKAQRLSGITQACAEAVAAALEANREARHIPPGSAIIARPQPEIHTERHALEPSEPSELSEPTDTQTPPDSRPPLRLIPRASPEDD